ncbi:hypothetical protein AAMO2058_001584600 [Amorphochlora amoebiformis]
MDQSAVSALRNGKLYPASYTAQKIRGVCPTVGLVGFVSSRITLVTSGSTVTREVLEIGSSAAQILVCGGLTVRGISVRSRLDRRLNAAGNIGESSVANLMVTSHPVTVILGDVTVILRQFLLFSIVTAFGNSAALWGFLGDFKPSLSLESLRIPGNPWIAGIQKRRMRWRAGVRQIERTN